MAGGQGNALVQQGASLGGGANDAAHKATDRRRNGTASSAPRCGLALLVGAGQGTLGTAIGGTLSGAGNGGQEALGSIQALQGLGERPRTGTNAARACHVAHDAT